MAGPLTSLIQALLITIINRKEEQGMLKEGRAWLSTEQEPPPLPGEAKEG